MRNGQGGRRRGRGGPRPNGSGAGRAPDMGNRIEVRQRGNAHQLLEKYKNLARDAASQGDRVTAEYYMQYADHYYRVLNEFRARQEEQRARHQRSDEGDDSDYGMDEHDGVDVDMRGPEPIALQGRASGDGEAAGDGDEAVAAESDSADAEANDRRRRRPRGRPRRDAQPDVPHQDADESLVDG